MQCHIKHVWLRQQEDSTNTSAGSHAVANSTHGDLEKHGKWTRNKDEGKKKSEQQIKTKHAYLFESEARVQRTLT